MKSRTLTILLLALAVLLGGFPLHAHLAQAQQGDAWDEYKPSFGVEINQFFIPRDTFNLALSEAQTANNHWLRMNGLLWSEVQPNSNEDSEWGNVAEFESRLSAASAAGMEVILVIRSTPTWAQMYVDYYCGPMKEENIPHFADFMSEVVKRYSQPPFNVKYYELWNEPDESRDHSPPIGVISPDGVFGCWGEKSDATYYGGRHYGKMLKAVYPAVKAEVPEAQIVLGGLLLPCKPGDWDYCNMSNFIKGILHVADGQDVFDYANFHGYSTYTTAYPTGILMERNEHWWASSGGMVEGKLNYLRQTMASYGTNKPILMTEAALVDPNNLSENDPVAFEAAKADYLMFVFTRNIARGIEGSTWYHMEKHGWSKSGLLNSDNERLPAYDAFEVLTTALDRALYMQELSLGSGILGYEFTKGNRIWVLFSENGTQKSITVPVGFARAYDLFGVEFDPEDGMIKFTRPIYIELVNTPPVAKDDRYTIDMEVGVLTVVAPGVLRNDVDRDWNALTAQLVDGPSYGVLEFNENGSFTYTPNNEIFDGEDSFTYRACDDVDCSEPATVTIADASNIFLPLILR